MIEFEEDKHKIILIGLVSLTFALVAFIIKDPANPIIYILITLIAGLAGWHSPKLGGEGDARK